MKKIGILIVSGLLVVTLIAGGLNLSSVFAQTPNQQVDDDDLRRTIQVTGTGSSVAQPDTAIIVVGVRTEAEEASVAMSENSQQVSDLIAALQQAGIAQADIQTQFINLNPRYADQPVQSGQPEVTGYFATNTLQVRVRDITEVGQILDTAVQAGSNLVESIRFEIGDQQEVLEQAREAAFTDARQKAEQLADLAGVQLGDLVTISDVSASPPMPYGAGGAQVAFEQAVPVEPGTQDVQVSLQVAWEISGGQAMITPIVPQTGDTVTRTPFSQATPTSTQIPAVMETPFETPTVDLDVLTPIATITLYETVMPLETVTPTVDLSILTPISTITLYETVTPLETVTPPATSGLDATAADKLRAQGATVRRLGNIQQPFFPVTGQLIAVNREQVQVFPFDSQADGQEAADTIARGGEQLSRLFTAHFFYDADSDSIILYTGNNQDTLDLLMETFGDTLYE